MYRARQCQLSQHPPRAPCATRACERRLPGKLPGEMGMSMSEILRSRPPAFTTPPSPQSESSSESTPAVSNPTCATHLLEHVETTRASLYSCPSSLHRESSPIVFTAACSQSCFANTCQTKTSLNLWSIILSWQSSTETSALLPRDVGLQVEASFPVDSPSSPKQTKKNCLHFSI